jgi:hypothetical protein
LKQRRCVEVNKREEYRSYVIDNLIANANIVREKIKISWLKRWHCEISNSIKIYVVRYYTNDDVYFLESIAMFRIVVSRKLSKKRSQEDESSKLRRKLTLKRLVNSKLHYYHIIDLIRIYSLNLIIRNRLAIVDKLL